MGVTVHPKWTVPELRATAEGNGGGATCDAESQGPKFGHEGHHTAQPAGAHQEVPRGGDRATPEANKGIADPHASRFGADLGRADDIRQAEELDVQGDARGLHEVGHPGDQSQSKFIGGAGALCQLGGGGVGAPDECPSGRPGGQGRDPSARVGGVGVGLNRVIGSSAAKFEEEFLSAKGEAEPKGSLRSARIRKGPITVEDEDEGDMVGVQLSEEALKEIQEAQAKLAAVKQKYKVAPGSASGSVK